MTAIGTARIKSASERASRLAKMSDLLKWPRRIIVAVAGGSVVLFGITLLVLPGPAFVVIPVGLGILSFEFVWARRWLAKLKRKVKEADEHLDLTDFSWNSDPDSKSSEAGDSGGR